MTLDALASVRGVRCYVWQPQIVGSIEGPPIGSPSGEALVDAMDRHVEGQERKPLLLLVHADADCAPSLLKQLQAENLDVVSCPLSAQADRLLDGLQPDLILLAPPSEKRQLLRACETLRGGTARPIVVLSERSEELVIERALGAGIDEYLVLPIGDRELAARIEAMLRRMNQSTDPKQAGRIGGLILSSADLSVERDGRRVFLSPIEFRLLSCLVSAPGKVFTHQTLMARVWGAEYVDCRQYLHLYIRYLREKLEEDPRSPAMILSEWGVGYRFQPPERVAV